MQPVKAVPAALDRKVVYRSCTGEPVDHDETRNGETAPPRGTRRTPEREASGP